MKLDENSEFPNSLGMARRGGGGGLRTRQKEAVVGVAELDGVDALRVPAEGVLVGEALAGQRGVQPREGRGQADTGRHEDGTDWQQKKMMRMRMKCWRSFSSLPLRSRRGPYFRSRRPYWAPLVVVGWGSRLSDA